MRTIKSRTKGVGNEEKEGQVQVSEKVKGTKKNGVLRDRDCWLQG